MVGGTGVEPMLEGSEPSILPLNEPPKNSSV